MIEFFYLYDPLCGWCYGAAPAVVKLELEPGVVLHPLPTGLFATPGRGMTPEFAEQAWANDQRIASLTGQAFSETYRAQVLGNPAGRFDSTAATRALTAVHLSEPAQELEALHRFQALRYAEGRDSADPAALAQALHDMGLDEAAELLAAEDPMIDETMAARQAMARRLMAAHGLQGVPALVRLEEGRTSPVPNALLFEDIEVLVSKLGLPPGAQDAIH